MTLRFNTVHGQTGLLFPPHSPHVRLHVTTAEVPFSPLPPTVVSLTSLRLFTLSPPWLPNSIPPQSFVPLPTQIVSGLPLSFSPYREVPPSYPPTSHVKGAPSEFVASFSSLTPPILRSSIPARLLSSQVPPRHKFQLRSSPPNHSPRKTPHPFPLPFSGSRRPPHNL